MAQLTVEQQNELKARVAEKLQKDSCITEIKNFRAGMYDVYDIDTIEFVEVTEKYEYIFVLLKSQVITGYIRRPFKPTRESYVVTTSTNRRSIVD